MRRQVLPTALEENREIHVKTHERLSCETLHNLKHEVLVFRGQKVSHRAQGGWKHSREQDPSVCANIVNLNSRIILPRPTFQVKLLGYGCPGKARHHKGHRCHAQ